MIRLIEFFLLIYIIGIIALIIHMSFILQKSYFEEKGIFITLPNIIYAILSNPSWLLLLSWFGLLMNFENKKE